MKLESERVHIRSLRFLQLHLPKALKADIEKQVSYFRLVQLQLAFAEGVFSPFEVLPMELNRSLQKQNPIRGNATSTLPVIADHFVNESKPPLLEKPEP